MKAKKILTTAAIVAMIATQGITAFAKTVDNDPQGDQHTTIGILESTNVAGQVSFSVPLYVTTAAVKGKADLLTPTGYDIKNEANVGGKNIAVLSVSISGVGDWSTSTTVPTDDKKVQLSIGGLLMPEVSRNITKTVELKDETNPGYFYDKDQGKYRPIEPGKTLSEAATQIAPGTSGYKGLEIVGKVAEKDRTDIAASAQFRITYLISPLNDQGEPVGLTYVGDDKPWQ